VSKYTPGLWEIVNRDMGIVASSVDGTHVCEVGAYGDSTLIPFNKARWDADKTLISAAPDLYEALTKAIADYGKPGGPWNVLSEPGTWIEMAKQAIAKADG
jgi:hypothetical protein